MAFDANDLSPHEHFVVERTRAGEIADFSPWAARAGPNRPCARAFCASSCLRLEPDAGGAARPASASRARASKARSTLPIVQGPAGACRWSNAKSPKPVGSEPCAAGAAVACEQPHVAALTAAQAQIGGELDLSGVAPIGAPGRETLIADLHGVRIGGDVLARGAQIRARDGRATRRAHAARRQDRRRSSARRRLRSLRLRLASGDPQSPARSAATARSLLNRSEDAKRRKRSTPTAPHSAAVIAARQDAKPKANMRFSRRPHRAAISTSSESASLRNEMGARAGARRTRAIGGQFAPAACKIAGKLKLQSACDRAQLWICAAPKSPIRITPRGDTFGRALDAAEPERRRRAMLQGANIKGEAFLADARIAGYLAFGGGRFINPGHWAIRAPERARRRQSHVQDRRKRLCAARPENGDRRRREVRRARIDGALSMVDARTARPGPGRRQGRGFSFADAEIDGPLQARALTTQQDARIDVSGASCAALDDDLKTGWGVEGGALDLEGFAYGRIDSDGEKWCRACVAEALKPRRRALLAAAVHARRAHLRPRRPPRRRAAHSAGAARSAARSPARRARSPGRSLRCLA